MLTPREELVWSWLVKALHDLATARKAASEPDPYEVGHAAWLQGDHRVTQSNALEALASFQALGDECGLLAALESLGWRRWRRDGISTRHG